jgi:hypothetical protein
VKRVHQRDKVRERNRVCSVCNNSEKRVHHQRVKARATTVQSVCQNKTSGTSQTVNDAFLEVRTPFGPDVVPTSPHFDKLAHFRDVRAARVLCDRFSDRADYLSCVPAKTLTTHISNKNGRSTLENQKQSEQVSTLAKK